MLHRQTPRAQRYDYASGGGYFITICTAGRQHYFGEAMNGKMILNDLGNIIDHFILSITDHFPHVEIHEHIVMPNHVHLLLLLSELPECRDANTARPVPDKNIIQRTAHDAVPTTKPLPTGPQYGSLGYIINQFKSICTREINKQSTGGTLQIPYGDTFARQPRYHDHIIRNEEEYAPQEVPLGDNKIKYYIQTNPQNRADDTFNK